jgi:hypothetical protein
MRKRSLLVWLIPGLAFLCVGCSLNEAADPQVAGIVKSITEGELRGYCEALATIGSRPGNNAPKTDLTLQFIESELKDVGYRAISTRPVGQEVESTSFNIIAQMEGTRHPECVVELGAHYDTVPFSPGADDNGSGIAGVLATARALSKTRCAKTIRFVFYCHEEANGAGSLTHARNILEDREERFEGVIVFEMIGYAVQEPDTQRTPVRIPFLIWPPSTGDFIAVVGDGKSAFIGERYETSVRKYEPELEIYSLKRTGGLLRDAARSDHASYWQSGLPALMLTDTAEFRNPNYHQPSDRIETLDFGFMCRVTRTAAATLLEWAEVEPEPEEWIDNADVGNPVTFYREPVQAPDPGPVPFHDTTVGLSTRGLTPEEACRRIATDYWNAAIRGDDDAARKLWCAFPAGGTMHWQEQFRPQSIVSIGTPHPQKGCFDGVPNLVVPSRIQFSNGRVINQNLIVLFRDLGMEATCVILGLWNES